ncbi:lipoprotein [Saccharopolyspora subtropica]|uniref:DUF4349 domain-containing protein n=2 Tax=Saccharopolyspora thermophila TaxID=89367 RepID=A0A917JYJ3_9PSEU|nr:lipoprotein [Saccharopolyspora subtropica]
MGRLRWPLVVLMALGALVGCSSAEQNGADLTTDSHAVAPSESGDTAQSTTKPGPLAPRQVVRTADVDIEVDDVAAAEDAVRRVSVAAGGFLQQVNSRAASTTLVARVPAGKLDQVLVEISQLGRVTSRDVRAEDVTDQLVDTGSRIESQRASVQRLRELMQRATTVDEIVSIESELTSRETELDALERRRAALSGQVEMATLTVSLDRPSTAPDEDTGFLAGLSGGWRALSATGAFLLTALGAVLPFAATLAAPAAATWLLVRRRAALRRPTS